MPRRLDSIHAIESCTFHLHSWRPFHLPTTTTTTTLESDSTTYTSTTYTSKPYFSTTPKRPCLSDRPTSFPIDSIDMSRLTLFDDDRSNNRKTLHWIVRKRRRRNGSRSVSGRSSDRSGTRRRSSAAYATCSDFPVAAGTDSSGELFLNGDANWASDVSDVTKNSRREREGGENLSSGFGQSGNFDCLGNESGYGSEPGYRGDAEFGYGDEFDEEEDDHRVLFWGEKMEGTDSNMEMAGEKTLQKAHHRCRRKKHDVRMVDPLR
ncbi:unnamed protein product [Camellia sinensis]